MLRKVQRIGNTFYISLPKEIASKLNLKKGDEIKISLTKEGEIFLTAYPEIKSEKHIQIKLNKDIDKKILTYYLLGYDNIKIFSEKKFSSDERENIFQIARKLSGIEIVEESTNFIVLQNLINDESIDPLKLLWRINSLTSTMYVDAIKAIYDEDDALLKNIIERDDEVDRLYFLFVRQIRSLISKPALMKKLNLSFIECLDLRLISQIIEKIGDETVNLALNFVKIKSEKNRKDWKIIYNYSLKIQSLQEKALTYFIKRKGEKIEEIKNKLKEIMENINKNNKMIIYLTPIINIILNIIDICDLTLYLS